MADERAAIIATVERRQSPVATTNAGRNSAYAAQTEEKVALALRSWYH